MHALLIEDSSWGKKSRADASRKTFQNFVLSGVKKGNIKEGERSNMP